MTATPLDRFLAALDRAGKRHRTAGPRQTMAQCPAHEDGNPSLSVREASDGTLLLKCFAGCENADVVAALGLGMGDLFAAEYRYDDGRAVRRSYDRAGKKRFTQSGNTQGVPQLYRLGRVRQAAAAGQTVYLVEGERDVHALESLGVVATTAPMGGGNLDRCDLSPLEDAQVVAVVDRDETGSRWAEVVRDRLPAAHLVHAAEGKDAADHIAAGRGLEDFVAAKVSQGGTPSRVSRDDAHAVFRRWLGDGYDGQALDAVLAAAAVERLDGDPLWLLLLSGSGNAKTETVQALTGAGAVLTSTIASEGALLSATAKRERAKSATGGLLRLVEPRGLLVVKDVTSILSMNRDMRATVLAALREVYDGQWARNVGTDGGQTLTWAGRVALVGAVTTAWDTAHAAVAAMGDRFVLLRMDSSIGRQRAGRQAIGNTGSEVKMRAELAAAVGGVLAGMDTRPAIITEAETDALLAAADVVTLARTAVEFDYRGNVADAHAPEMPTRFAKQLAQVVRGAVAIGVPRGDALHLAIRCARDSMPPLRLAIIDDVAAHPGSTAHDIRKRIDKPRATVDRQCQALHMLGVLTCDELEYGEAGRSRWFYSLADGIEPNALKPESAPEKLVGTSSSLEEREETREPPRTGSDKSGPLCPVCGRPNTADRHAAGLECSQCVADRGEPDEADQ